MVRKMTEISLFGGYNKKVHRKNLRIFKTLCKKFDIEVLIVGRRYKGNNYIDGISSANTISLHARDEAYDRILEDLKNEFEVFKTSSYASIDMGTIGLLNRIKENLYDTQKTLERRHLVECSACNRPIIIQNFCPYCGNKVDGNVKLCDECDKVHVPAYTYCPDCGNTLIETSESIYEFVEPSEFFWGIEREYIKGIEAIQQDKEDAPIYVILIKQFNADIDAMIRYIKTKGTEEQKRVDLPRVIRVKKELEKNPGLLQEIREVVNSFENTSANRKKELQYVT